ncbi:hypothetical protein BCR42DRAFT_491817 [Absidia repens]|uniref:FAS1 domain-containing protein n=1 Tax=Absidia repens TaxID=90262 RepID=A0A1X2IFV4_9FUNG|nr:hypothetical protein BCR42DRAFT_491817 [Absidia repens]
MGEEKLIVDQNSKNEKKCEASPSPPQLTYQAKAQLQLSQSHHGSFTDEQSLFDKLAPESDLSIFLELLMHNDLLFNYLNSTTSQTTTTTTTTGIAGQSLTVFCPTNQAFLDYWKTQPKKSWHGLLERHIVPQTRLDPIS